MNLSFCSRRFIKITFLLCLCLLLGIAIVTSFSILKNQVSSSPLNTNKTFVKKEIASTIHQFDLGVADINGDDWLDIFTTNHSARQLLLINQERREFTDRLTELGLSQNYEIPGAEPANMEPDLDRSGIYIYWKNGMLIVRTIGIDSIKGKIELPELGIITESKSFNIKIRNILPAEKEKQLPIYRRKNQKVIEFASEGEGQNLLTINSRRFFFTAKFELDKELPLNKIYVGLERRNPDSHSFLLPMRDRHGMAWADYNQDGKLDTFIVRGGLGGRMMEIAPETRDELLVFNGFTFEEVTQKAEILKYGCPARQVSALDYNRDGLVDIYVVCGRGKPPGDDFQNYLYKQKKNGKFREVSKDIGLNLKGIGIATWIDIEGDGELDLFWSDRERREFWLYRNQQGNFAPELIGKYEGHVKQVTVADYDQEGDLDIFAASNGGNILLQNQNGNLEITDPTQFGLPSQSIQASWVDYNNDGLIDIHTLPDGLYEQDSTGHFRSINLLNANSSLAKNSQITWFDADNDGYRDLLLLTLDSTPKPLDKDIFIPKKGKVSLYQNQNATNKNHWLEIELSGAESGVTSFGSLVQVKTANRNQIEQVGQSEGSLRSQGHYRLYFGLGKQKEVNSIQVIWSDGTKQIISNPSSDQLLTIQYPI